MIYKTLFLIIILSFFLFLYNSFNNNIFAISSFIREEVIDSLKDVYNKGECNWQLGVCHPTNNTSMEIKSIDIEGATYLSDGRFINTSLWVNNNPIENLGSKYAVIVDIDSNPETGGTGGGDYIIQVSLDRNLKKWTRQLIEVSDFGRGNKERNSEIITKKILENSPITNPIHIDIDLKDLNFPKSFDMIFYAATERELFEDYTSWIHIPPPSIQISFYDNPFNIRPGETKDIHLQINSTTALESIIQLVPENKTSNIEWKLEHKNQIIKLPAYGSTILPIQIYAKNVTAGDKFLFPIFAKSSFPKLFRPEIKTISSDQPFTDKIDRFNLVINILNPIEPHEHLKKFVENWFNPLTGVYQAASGIMGGLAGYILAKFKSKKTISDKT